MVSLNIIGLNYTMSCKYINFNIEYNYIISVSYSVCTTKLTITLKKNIPGSTGIPAKIFRVWFPYIQPKAFCIIEHTIYIFPTLLRPSDSWTCCMSP